jgi:integrase
MSIAKREKSPFWQYEFQINGRRFRGSTGEASKRKAEAFEKARKREVKDAFAAGHSGVDLTLADASLAYWNDSKQSSTEQYQLVRLADHFGEATPLSQITHDMVRDYAAVAHARPSRRGGRPSNATVNREIELLRRVMLRVKRQVRLHGIDWSEIKRRETKGRTRYLTDTEESRLHDELIDYLKAPFRFSLLTGLRSDNVFSLDWGQVSLDDARIDLIVKGGKPHTIPLSDEAVAILSNQDPKTTGPVFTNAKGEKINSATTAWTAARRRAKVVDLRWHDLRHTAASRMVAAGADISEVKEILGHENIATTARYIHASADRLREVVETISRKGPRSVKGDANRKGTV